MSSTSKIVYIPVERIKPNPKNPRKDLGDLSELAESIRVNGVLQNLTIVPEDVEKYQKQVGAKKAYTGDFIAVIGHRRNAASKLAGLKDVPCIISFMDERQQVAVMLVENIQRNELNIYEQAQGFQMMLDMGVSVGTLAEMSGFSQSTIRQRVKLTQLDQEKFEESISRGASLGDYTKLEKIKDEEVRNSLLEDIGTHNFDNQYLHALKNQERRENRPQVIAALSVFAKECQKSKGEHVGYYSFDSSAAEVKKPKDADTRQYFYTVNDWGATLYGEAVDGKKELLLGGAI